MVVTPEYAGDLSAREAWALLESNPDAQLVDVRTMAEWAFVGLPELAKVHRELLCVEWQNYPAGARNPDFVAATTEKLRNIGATAETPVVFLCRSGGRSRSAAIAMTKAGYSKAYNLSGGFEGGHDAAGHRGTQDGWKATGLPWRQS